MKTRADVANLMEYIFNKCQETRNVAHDEYAHTANALANFQRLAGELAITQEQVLWVYLRKHLDGMVAWVKGFRSQREDIRGRIIDSIVYEVLLWAIADEYVAQWQAGVEPKQQFDQYNFDKAAVLINALEFLNGYNPAEGGEYGTIVLDSPGIQVTIQRVQQMP